MNQTETKNAIILLNYNNNVVSDLLSCLDKYISDYSICVYFIIIITLFRKRQYGY